MDRESAARSKGHLLQPGEFVSERFQIQSALDTGSVAEVYHAIERPGGRSIALKVFLERHAGERAGGRRVRRELKALQRLVHPNVARVLGTGVTQDGHFWIATEYVEGETLRRYLRRQRILGIEETLSLAVQLAEALSAAHACSVLHRDLKPENIFVTSAGIAKVADFGTTMLAAELHDRSSGRFGIGTPAYLAPERLIDERGHFQNDPRSDLYSLGIIEYEMLAGYNPVLGSQKALSRTEVAWRQASVPPRVPVGVPLEVWSVLEPTLRKEPDRRPASAREHAAQLRRLLNRLHGHRGALPVAWTLPSSRTPEQLFLRRTLRSIAWGMLLGVLAGSLVFMGWWFGVRSVSGVDREHAPLTGAYPHE